MFLIDSYTLDFPCCFKLSFIFYVVYIRLIRSPIKGEQMKLYIFVQLWIYYVYNTRTTSQIFYIFY